MNKPFKSVETGTWRTALMLATALSLIGGALFWQDMSSSARSDFIALGILPGAMLWGIFFYLNNHRRLYTSTVFLIAALPVFLLLEYVVGRSDANFSELVDITFKFGGAQAALLVLTAELIDMYIEVRNSNDRIETFKKSNIWLTIILLAYLGYYSILVSALNKDYGDSFFWAREPYFSAVLETVSLLLLAICGLALWSRLSHLFAGAALMLALLAVFVSWYPIGTSSWEWVPFNVSLAKFVSLCVVTATVFAVTFRHRLAIPHNAFSLFRRRGFYVPALIGIAINLIGFSAYKDAQITILDDFSGVKMGFGAPIIVGDPIADHVTSIGRGENYWGSLGDKSTLEDIDESSYKISRDGVAFLVEKGIIKEISISAWGGIDVPIKTSDGKDLSSFSTNPSELVTNYGTIIEDWYYPAVEEESSPLRQVVFQRKPVQSGIAVATAVLNGDMDSKCRGNPAKNAYCLPEVVIALEDKTSANLYPGSIDLSPMNLTETTIKAKRGDSKAQFDLGVFYSTGLYRAKLRYDVAASWYRAAAEQDHSLAQAALGGMFQDGQGVSKDPLKAYMWYAIADRGVFLKSGTSNTFAIPMWKLAAVLTTEQILTADRQALAWRSAYNQRTGAHNSPPPMTLASSITAPSSEGEGNIRDIDNNLLDPNQSLRLKYESYPLSPGVEGSGTPQKGIIELLAAPETPDDWRFIHELESRAEAGECSSGSSCARLTEIFEARQLREQRGIASQ